MRLVGRYFAIGTTLGSVTGLVALLLIWGWMTIHLGVLGFAFGWIPAGLAAGLLWLAMVVFWAPAVVVGAMIAASLMLLTSHGRARGHWEETPTVITPPEERFEPAPEPEEPQAEEPSPETPAETTPPPEQEVEAAPPPAEPSLPQEEPPLPPIGLAPESPSAPAERSAPPSVRAAPPAKPTTHQHPSDDLGSDAAAAGDTSRRSPR